MALSYTDINTTPENLGDRNFLYIKAAEVSGRGTLIQTYIEKPFNIKVPRNTDPVTFKTEQVNPVLSEQSFFAPGITVSDLSGLVVSPAPNDFIPWTTLLTEILPRGQRRITRAAEVVGKGSLIQVYTETKYEENNKPKLTMSPERLYWVDGVEVSGSDLVPGYSYLEKHYGEIWVNGNIAGTSLSSLSTWEKFVGFSQNGLSRGAIPLQASGFISVFRSGTYLANASVSFYGGPSSTYELGVFANGGVIPFANVHAERKLSAGGDIGSASLSGLISLVTTNTVELWVRQTTGVLANPTLRDATLSIVEL